MHYGFNFENTHEIADTTILLIDYLSLHAFLFSILKKMLGYYLGKLLPAVKRKYTNVYSHSLSIVELTCI